MSARAARLGRWLIELTLDVTGWRWAPRRSAWLDWLVVVEGTGRW